MAQSKAKFKVNYQGVGELLKSTEIQNEVERRANNIASTAGEGWEVEPRMSAKGDRVAVVVFTNDPKAQRDNAKNHTLVKSIDAGRV